jgi:gamma-glutamylaminecyclotransferase
MTATLLFVYGSLKAGFPNAHRNAGRRRPGVYCTVERHGLWLVGGRLPCLFEPDGSGHRVRGELYEVTPEQLAAMDRFERVGEPGGYRRKPVWVAAEGQPPGTPLQADAYLQHPALLASAGPHEGPLEAYTLEQARRLQW